MALGLRVVDTFTRSDRAQADALAGPTVPPMHAFRDGRGRLAGTALTVKTRPGDNLIIHKDGLVAIPRAPAEEALALARAQVEKEATIRAAIAGEGRGRARVDERRRARGCAGA